MVGKQKIRVEVAYALPDEQCLVEVQIDLGSTARYAIAQSGLLLKFPHIDLSSQKIGVFSRFIDVSTVLSDGDRVEIYRPLEISPKKARRLRARRASNK
ncbi:MAG: RnfH family protein [Gammaproteobacteria bacterium]|nr:RnfH family protein [Gammaproteobacteria bacterium]